MANCKISGPTIYWKTESPVPATYSHVLVAVILPQADSSLRIEMEQSAVMVLKQYGINGIAASERFGLNGLGNLSQDSTFLKLCDNGIDAILSVARVIPKNPGMHLSGTLEPSPAVYFFRRIWNYKNSTAVVDPDTASKTSWESILFDLSTLRPVIVLTAPSSVPESASTTKRWPSRFVTKMISAKVINPAPRKAALKGF